MRLDVSNLNKAFNIQGDDYMEVDEGSLEPVSSNWRGRPGMHSEEGKREIGEASRKRSSKTYRLVWDDGREEVVTNLEGWCRDNGYLIDNVRKIGKTFSGKLYRSHKGVILCNLIDEESDYNPYKWVVEKSDGMRYNVFSLKKWCDLNGYNAGAMVQMSKGKKDNYKDIVKIERM